MQPTKTRIQSLEESAGGDDVRGQRLSWTSTDRLLLFVASTALLADCGVGTVAEPTLDVQDEASRAEPSEPVEPTEQASTTPTNVEGTVGGHRLEALSAVLVWRPMANDATLVLSDSEALCDTLTAGAKPRDSVVLYIPLRHNTRELQDAPWGSGEYPLRDESGEIQPRDAQRVLFMALGSACEPTFQSEATSGSIHLIGPEAGQGVTVNGELELHFGDEVVSGPFEASVCPEPEREPNGCL